MRHPDPSRNAVPTPADIPNASRLRILDRERPARAACATVATLLVCCCAMTAGAGAAGLPDHRAYELVVRNEEDGHEVDLNGVEGGIGYPSRNGEALDWEAIGGCCGATSAAQETYQSDRQATGWHTTAITPRPKTESIGPLELFGSGQSQDPVYWTPDLKRTIFLTPESFAAGDHRPRGRYDLYLEGPSGELTWLSQGPSGTGDQYDSAEFDGAALDASLAVFSSAEPLTPNATGITSPGSGAQYLYLRNVAQESTTLLDVDNSEALLGTHGASLGDGSTLAEDQQPVDEHGTTTHAISEDGSKVFFETPPEAFGQAAPHLYMRDLLNRTTTPIDNPQSARGARYEGASTDGSLVFFTSTEGLGGAPASATELYEFDTTTEPIGTAAPAKPTPISIGSPASTPTTDLTTEAAPGDTRLTVTSTTGFAAGRTITIEGESSQVQTVLDPTTLELAAPVVAAHLAGASVTEQPGSIVGVTAIANDGSRVYFVATDVLATNHNPLGRSAQEGQPNLYLYDTRTGETTFVATLDWLDVHDCTPNCEDGSPAGLVAEPDISRAAYPTPDGSALVFESTADLTAEDDAPTTRLTAPVHPGEHTLEVESTAGLLAGEPITIGTGADQQLETIEAINGQDELTIGETGREGSGVGSEFESGATVSQPDAEIYRYSVAGSLTCISCAGAQRTPIGSSTLGLSGGGTYAPYDQNVPMNESASQIFFETATPLLPEAQAAQGENPLEASNVYEWEGGHLSLISDGSTAGSLLDGTTPSGDDVFISSRSQLTSGETGNWINVYDARVDGGFPSLPTETAPCSAEACRSSTDAAPFLALPASATLDSMTETGVAHGEPSITVASVTSAQRAHLARTGWLSLRITAAAGHVEATINTIGKGTSIRAAHASASLAAAGRIVLRLHLSRPAIRRLRRTRHLQLAIRVSDSASPTVKVARLTLRLPGGRTSAQRRPGA